jgi:hypothetical protein
MDILKGLFKTNQSTETDDQADTPTSESSNQERQDIQRWDNPIQEKSLTERQQAAPRLNQRVTPGPRVNPMQAGPRPHPPGMNPRQGFQRQMPTPFMPHPRAIQAPRFGQPSGIPRQNAFNAGQNPLGQQWRGAVPYRFNPSTPRQVQRVDAWGIPLPRHNSPSLGPPLSAPGTGYPLQQRNPNGFVFSRPPRRPVQPFQGPWY